MFTGGVGIYLYELAGLVEGSLSGRLSFVIDREVGPQLKGAAVTFRGHKFEWRWTTMASLSANVTVPFGSTAAVSLPLPLVASEGCLERVCSPCSKVWLKIFSE
jgi:hypothetical protein